MSLSPHHALRGALQPVPAGIRRVRVLVAGATGATGEAMLVQLAASPRVAQVGVLLQRPATMAIRRVHGVVVDPAGAQPWPRPPAAEGVILFDPPRLFHGREKALLPVRPPQLPEVARWMRDCGVARLLVVLPHDQGRLPGALRRGLANLDEQAVAAMGFDTVVFVRSARAPAREDHRHPLHRLARAMLGVLHHLVPARQKPVSAERVARFATALLAQAPAGLHVVAPEQVWAAAQGEPEDVLTHWLQGVAPTPDNAA